MILFMNNKTYINKVDIKFILEHHFTDTPEEFYDNLKKASGEKFTEEWQGMVFSTEDEYTWVGFEGDVCKEYLRDQEYIVDFNECINMSNDEIDNELNGILIHRQKILNYFDSLDKVQKALKIRNVDINIDMLDHMYNSIVMVLNVKNGYKDMPLPTDESLLVTDDALIGPVKVSESDKKHVYFLSRMLNFNLKEVCKYTHIK